MLTRYGDHHDILSAGLSVQPETDPRAVSQEYDKKREEKNRNRQIYYLRHARDYEVLGVPVGTPKPEIKALYKKLALKMHPDRVPEAQREEATKRFQDMRKAYDNLMTTDEEIALKALQARGK
jgi:DnaJ domain